MLLFVPRPIICKVYLQRMFAGMAKLHLIHVFHGIRWSSTFNDLFVLLLVRSGSRLSSATYREYYMVFEISNGLFPISNIP